MYGGKAIEPLWECKNDSEITTLIAHGLGYEEHYPYFTDEEWIDIGLDSDENRARGIDHATLKERWQSVSSAPRRSRGWSVGLNMTMSSRRRRGELRFTVRYLRPATNTVKIGKAKPKSSSYPIWLPPFENWPGAEIRSKYPLGYLQLHQRGRTHSQWFASETLREIDKEPLLHISRPDDG